MDNRLEITIKQLANGFTYEIHGPHKLGGEFICKSTEEHEMIEKIGQAICGYKIEVVRK